jgi:hypothetical protein
MTPSRSSRIIFSAIRKAIRILLFLIIAKAKGVWPLDVCAGHAIYLSRVGEGHGKANFGPRVYAVLPGR